MEKVTCKRQKRYVLTLQVYPYICSWDVAAYPRENEWESQFRFRKMPLNTFDHVWHFQSFRYHSSVLLWKVFFFENAPFAHIWGIWQETYFQVLQARIHLCIMWVFFFREKKKIMPNKHVLHFYHVLIYRSGSKKNLMWSVREKTQCENSMWSVREKT